MKADKLRVVFDTSLYISAFTFPDSKSYQAYFLAVVGKVILFSSPEIVKELANKLTSNKFGLTAKEVEKIVKRIGKTATFVKPKKRLNILEDGPETGFLNVRLSQKPILL